MTSEDWRSADSALVAGLYSKERLRWMRELAWDNSAVWDIVEQGRLAGHVAGWIVRDAADTIRGWTFYLLHHGDLQIGGLTAERTSDTQFLLDCVLESPDASQASSISCFVFPAAVSLISALKRRRFTVRRSLYLSRPISETDLLGSPEAAGVRVRAFGGPDMLNAVQLLARAYEGEPGAACFAPNGRLDEWLQYLDQLLGTPACGQFFPAGSLVAVDTTTGQMAGLVLSTRLADRTAHIAQLAVGREARRRGIGEMLTKRAYAAAGRAGCEAMTLMVDEANEPALTLYARQGFSPRGAFVSGRRPGSVRASDELSVRLERAG